MCLLPEGSYEYNSVCCRSVRPFFFWIVGLLFSPVSWVRVQEVHYGAKPSFGEKFLLYSKCDKWIIFGPKTNFSKVLSKSLH